MVTLAQTLGTLSLILNSVRDGDDDEAADGRLAKTEGGPLEPLANTVAGAAAAPPDARSRT